MDLEIIIPKAKSLMRQEKSLRKSIVNKGIKMYSRIVDDLYIFLESKQNMYRILDGKKIVKHSIGYHHSLYDFTSCKWWNEFRTSRLPMSTNIDMREILRLLIRDYLCQFFCFDIANVIISFIQYDITSNTVYGMYRKLIN